MSEIENRLSLVIAHLYRDIKDAEDKEYKAMLRDFINTLKDAQKIAGTLSLINEQLIDKK